MVRTKHVLIFILVLAGLTVAFLLYGLFHSKAEVDGPVAMHIENPFVSESPIFTVLRNPEQNKKSIRELFLAKLGTVKHNALTITSEEPSAKAIPEPVEVEVAPPTQGFDWSSWANRLAEFEVKKMQYDTHITNIKAALVTAETGKNILSNGVSASATETPATLIASNGAACFDAEIARGNKTLQNPETTSLGLLYKVITDEIRLQKHEAQVIELDAQIQIAEPKFAEVMNAYTRERTDCGHFVNEYQEAVGG